MCIIGLITRIKVDIKPDKAVAQFPILVVFPSLKTLILRSFTLFITHILKYIDGHLPIRILFLFWSLNYEKLELGHLYFIVCLFKLLIVMVFNRNMA